MRPLMPDMIDTNGRNSPWFEWYYRAFAPPAAPANASLLENELSKRGRLSSVLLLCGFFVALLAFPVAFGPNKALFPILLSGLALIACSLVINKMGHMTVAGILCVLCTETCLLSAAVTTPPGLTLFSLPLLDMLIIPEIIAVSLLAPWSVFIVAAANSVFFISFFVFLHHDAVLDAAIQSQGYDTLLRPIVIQFAVAIVTYLWMQRMKRALQKADRTEVIALLQADLLGAQNENQRCKQELARVIAVLEDAQNRIARGDLSVRIPLEGEILSSIGGKFNNLINRFQRALKSESDLMYLQQAINYIVSEVDVARERGGPFQLRRTGTQLDSLLLAFLVLQQNQETASRTLHPNPASSVHNHRPITRNLNPDPYNSGAYNPVTPMPPIPATNLRSDWQSSNQKQSKTSPFRLRSLYPSPLQADK